MAFIIICPDDRWMLLAAPGQTLLALITFLGFYWLITGLLGLVQVFVDRSTT